MISQQINRSYRPWGDIDWLLRHGPEKKWSFIGCLGTEKRSLAAWRWLKKNKNLCWTRLFRIFDKPSRFRALTFTRLHTQEKEFIDNGGEPKDIVDHDLMEPHEQIIKDLSHLWKEGNEDVILDVSSLPKRFFFPLLKELVLSRTVSNIIVTYTTPEQYTEEKLSENYADWAHLPSFAGKYDRQPFDIMIVNVGYSPMGLQSEVDQGNPGLPIKLIFPFPAPLRSVQRAWEFVRRLQKIRGLEGFDIYLTEARDVSDAFDRLLSLTDNGSLKSILAPFGPKPISVAMCLFAVLTDSVVSYSQPTVYHPDYSAGINQIYGYWLRLNGADLYNL